ncbi:MAG TPA: hypothetical protein VEQ85_11785, partial [Lacipirellulaceae bacterium]|nr:hypothetical protein [Lacipirellulaceae bacterium]
MLFATAMGAAVTAATPAPSRAAFVGRQLVASGLSAPMFAAHVPGDPTRLFIAERGAPNESSTSTATIRVLDLTTNTLLPTPFL